MIRLIMTAAGLAALAVLILAIRHDPAGWVPFLHAADHQARQHGTWLDAHLPRTSP